MTAVASFPGREGGRETHIFNETIIKYKTTKKQHLKNKRCGTWFIMGKEWDREYFSFSVHLKNIVYKVSSCIYPVSQWRGKDWRHNAAAWYITTGGWRTLHTKEKKRKTCRKQLHAQSLTRLCRVNLINQAEQCGKVKHTDKQHQYQMNDLCLLKSERLQVHVPH